VIDPVFQHIVDMIQFGLAISARIINAIVGDPELVEVGRAFLSANDNEIR
jgi:hypothetical protein